MAKKSVLNRNEKRIATVARQSELRTRLRKQRVDPKLSDEERYAAQMQLQKLDRNGCRARIKNRCQLSGRARGVYRKFMLSRILFREYAHKGLIPGVTKASW